MMISLEATVLYVLFCFPWTGVVSVAFDFPSSSLCLDYYESTSHVFFMKDISMAVMQESDVLIPLYPVFTAREWTLETREVNRNILFPPAFSV